MYKITLHKYIPGHTDDLITTYEEKTKDDAAKIIRCLLYSLDEYEEQGLWGGISIRKSEK